ncbi:phosphoribosylformylglycinamidine synthase I [Candidatus Parvarchaeota archaeon]|nr:phosphoribosylformylglycinamidine synthase I [Candidatus Parvarchaeota archaeon]
MADFINGKPRACVIGGFGINCENETAYALELSGAASEKVNLVDLLSGKKSFSDYHLIAVPGGFSFGDDLGSGKVIANKLKFGLRSQLSDFISSGGLVIGICNGFQAIIKLGLLPAFDGKYFEQAATLTFNDSGRFEDRWVYMKANAHSQCVFTKGIKKLYLPVRHGEGKFVPKDEGTLERLVKGGHIALQYTDKDGSFSGYPDNPNGSVHNIAGICDETGRVFGLMPHPEAYLHKANHPRFTRNEAKETLGLQIYKNGIDYINANAKK